MDTEIELRYIKQIKIPTFWKRLPPGRDVQKGTLLSPGNGSRQWLLSSICRFPVNNEKITEKYMITTVA